MQVISKVIKGETYHYNVYKRKKKNGGFRVITAPEPTLKVLQKDYANVIYDNVKHQFSSEITGFMPGVSIKDNAKCHLNKEWVINLDIKSFFPSTTKNLVSWALRQANLGADLETATEILTLDNALPQGSPASPVIANFVAVHYVDPVIKEVLNTYLGNIRYEYSRYADDITISLDTKVERLMLRNMVTEICRRLESETPYKIAADKIKVRNKAQQQCVTGIIVNQGFSINKKTKLALRAAMHRVSLGQKELDSKLKGKLNFVRQVKPELFEKLTKGIEI